MDRGKGRERERERKGEGAADTRAEEVGLLRGVARGDTRAFERLFRRYYPRLSAFFLRRTRDPHATEELVQETMMVVWERAGTFDETSKPSTWILGIGYRKYLEWERARSRAHALFSSPADADAAEEPRPEDLEDFGDPRGDPVARAVSREALVERVRRAVERLPEEHRLVVELTFRQGLSYPEIAEVLGIPPGTVKSRMFHAKRKLKELLVRDGLKGDALWQIARGT